ncbi:MAG TPA: MATE family efflux transporter, partial [Candidatus Limnocylindria bacterium]|nr:MATE family efflux transporter [Candidatus Limnocylindria bacterium]
FLLNQNMPIHYPRPLRPRFNAQTARGIFRVALPSGIENVIFLTSKLFIGIIIAGYPAAMIAANAAANTLTTYISIPANAINLVTITVVSQCVGGGRGEEARKSTLKLQGISVAALLVTSGLVALFINPLAGMLHLSPESFAHTRAMVLVYCLFAVFFWSPAFGIPNALRAAGDNRFVMVAASLTVVGLRLAGSVVLGNVMGLMIHGIWYAMYLDWVGRAVIFALRFRGGKWLKCRLV